MIKAGVKLAGITPVWAIAWPIIIEAYRREGFTPTITSALDGKHKVGSLHYSGDALDLRIWHIPPITLNRLVMSIKNLLGKDFDVVLESDHIHVEYDPKEK